MSATAATIDRSVMTCPLHNARDLHQAGNKAYNLSHMIELGLDVPTGFVITNAAFQHFLQENHIDLRVSRRPNLDNARIPHSILDEVFDLRHILLPSGPVVVRSSAIGEDSLTASFAGQLDSILNVTSDAELEHALLACWSSYWNERVLSYQSAKRIRLRGMAVIVQAQARSRVSGVLFTKAPGSSAAEDHLCVEYCAGLGDELVSGRMNPGRFRIARADRRCIVDIDGDLDPERKAYLFDPRQIDHLVYAAELLEEYFGRPQDIEWTIDDWGKLLLLQSRPISVAPFESASRVLWSNANVNENFPSPITPLLYSIAREGYYHYFRNLALAFGLSARRIEAMEPSLRYLVGVHDARIYYNLTNIHSVLRLAPFGEQLAQFFNDFVGAGAMAASKTPAPPMPRWFQAIELVCIVAKASTHFAFLTKRVEQFECSVDAWAGTTRPQEFDNCSTLALRDMLRGFMEIRCRKWTNASLADAASMIFYGILRLSLRSAYPDASESALHNNLLKGLGGVVSVQPALELWELSRRILDEPELKHWFSNTGSADILSALDTNPPRQWLRSELQTYLAKWGFRFSGELMLTAPSLEENPVPLIDMLRTYLKARGAAPVDDIGQLAAEQEAATSRVLEDLRKTKRLRHVPRRLQAPLVNLLLKATQRAIRLRERARSKQALLYNRCRRIALAIGGRLVRAGTLREIDDVFFLTMTELDELLSGHAMFPSAVGELIAVRKRTHETITRTSAPDTFSWAEGGYYVSELDNRPEVETTGEMCGSGACGGQRTAHAAVLGSVSDAGLLQVGDILVTRQTDPGWAPVFPLISGLVIERGGMLSHGAIIAREFGLPCVVGVKDATTRIAQRSLLNIDGDHGRVRILD